LKKFQHKLLDPIVLEREDRESGRVYKTPEGHVYPSVTSVLSQYGDKTALYEWRKRVGEEVANAHTARSSSRGTRIHNLMEKHVLHQEYDLSKQPPINVEMFKQIKDYVEKHVDIIYGPEHKMYSNKLKMAGTTDLICRMHGTTTIVDYKTSTYHKKEEWVQNYFLQAAAYAVMLYERYNMYAPNFCVLIATEQEGLQFFWKSTNDYVPKLQKFLVSINHC
jgi:ATP-dependent exoDNAse (exonuclease V) beta subunit